MSSAGFFTASPKASGVGGLSTSKRGSVLKPNPEVHGLLCLRLSSLFLIKRKGCVVKRGTTIAAPHSDPLALTCPHALAVRTPRAIPTLPHRNLGTRMLISADNLAV
jgi:hypothetical protein